MILVNILPEQVEGINQILKGARSFDDSREISHSQYHGCPALPTCGLALAESERYLPGLIDRIEVSCNPEGMDREEIIIPHDRLSQWLRPPPTWPSLDLWEGPRKYNVYVGGNESGTRLNRVYLERQG